jgi:hypothetical protein
MAELSKAVDPVSPGGLYARLGGKLGVPRIHSDQKIADLTGPLLPPSCVAGGRADHPEGHP